MLQINTPQALLSFFALLFLTTACSEANLQFASEPVACQTPDSSAKFGVNPGPVILFPTADTVVSGTVTVTGSCVSGVPVFIEEISGKTTTVDCNQNVFRADVVLSDGDGIKDLSVSQKTASDGTNIVDRMCFLKDTMSPVVNIVDSNTAQSTNSSTSVVSGTCEAGLPVALAGPGLSAPVTTTCPDGTFSVAVQLNPGEGTKNIIGTQVDRAGNQGLDSTAVRIDTSAPLVRITSAVPAVTNLSSLVVSGTCEAGLPLEIGNFRATTAPAVSCPSGTFTANIPLPAADGLATLRVFQVDNAGNMGFDSRNTIKDTVAPAITISLPLANAYLNPTSTFSGSCETGLSVELSGTALSSARSVNCTSGQWTLTSSITSGQGAKTLIASQTDGAGNIGQSQRSFLVDTVAPVLAFTSPASNSYIGASFNVTGTCESSLTVQLSGAGILPSTSTACTNGVFSALLNTSALDGTKTVTASQTDAAGNTGSASRNFLRDSLAPRLTIDSPANGSYVGANINLSGTCEAGLTVNFSGSGLSTTSSVTCSSSGTYASTVSLSAGDGNKAILATETDAAGNATSANGNYLRDTTAPLVAITSPIANTIGQTGLTVAGNCEAGLNVTLAGSGVATSVIVACSSSGLFTGTIAFTAGNGTKLVTASQTDAAGNTGSDSRSFISDLTPPSITITAPAANSYLPTSFTVQGACEMGLVVVVGGAGLAADVSVPCSGGAYSANVNVSAGEGSKLVTAKQTDAVGNTATASRTFLRDTVAPLLTITSPANGTSARGTIQLVGTCESGLTVSFSGPGLSTASSVTCSAGSYTANLTFSANDGAKTINVSETDAAGNTTQVSGTYNNDMTPPTIAITSPAANTSAQNGLTIDGTCEAGLNVTLAGSGVATPVTVACSSSGLFTGTIAFSSGSGVKAVTASQTDAVGNTGTSSRNFVRDLTAPTVTISSPVAGSYLPSNFTVQGSCETGLTVSIAGAGISNATTASCTAGAYSASVSVSSGDGTKNITAQQTDLAGNIGLASQNYLRDTAAPILAITSPTTGSSVPASVSIVGTCETGRTVSLSGDITAASGACTSGGFNISVTFSAGLGTKNVQASQTDLAGNVGQATAQYTRDSNGASETFISDASFGKIDILFIDDNSASMDPNQASLGAKFSGFASELLNIDWQIGITTTDCSTGPYGICGSLLPMTGTGNKILTPSVANYQTVFNNSIRRPETVGCLSTGTCPSGNSEPLLSATTAMNKYNTDNNGFFRTNSDLAIVILSDADERQTGGATYANRPTELVSAFNSIWPSGKKLKVYSIIVQPNDATCLATMKAGSNGFSFYGTLVDQTVNLTNGISTSICAPDYSVTLKSIGESVRTLTNSVALAHTPVTGSVMVTFTPNQSITYKVIGNRVVFDSPPSVGTQIKVDYQY